MTQSDPVPLLPAASKEMVQVARELRQRVTLAEAELWKHLRGRRLLGRKFRRQHPVARYVLDFYCDDARLVVELDGGVHAEPEQRERDLEREEVLNSLGLTVLRFSNEEILGDLDRVLARIEAHLIAQTYEHLDE